MSKVSVIIPVHNLFRRGLKRVVNSVYSLSLQKEYIEEIIIVNSSVVKEFEELCHLLRGCDVRHIHSAQMGFNKPLLLNMGIKAAKGEYIMCTDADYIFKYDFLKTCEDLRGKNVMMHKQVGMLPNMRVSQTSIVNWKFPKTQLNKWGTLANGACQYAHKDWFKNNLYPEDMDGFSAMDNIMTYMAYNNGLDIVWVSSSEILHQHHKIENKMGGENRVSFDRNQRILNEYIKKHNLPCLLSK